jgi:type I restriction enzyme S subunit
VTELPASWAETELARVADLGSGGTPKAGTPEYYGGPIPWAVIGDLTDGPVTSTAGAITEAGLQNSSAKVVGPDVVLIAMYGSIGKLGLPDISMATNQAIAFARPYPDVLNRKYLFYCLMHARQRLLAAGKGATQRNISQTILRSWPIALAPFTEQERIVAAIEEEFSRLDVGAAALDRVRRNLRRMRAAVLQAAVTGRLSRRESSDGSGADVLSAVLHERAAFLADHPYTGSRRAPNEPDTAGLPHLPDEWTWATIDQLSTRVVDGVHKKPNYVASGIPFITVRNLTKGPGISFDEVSCITPEDHAEFCRRTNPEYGDLLVTKDGTLGVVRAIRDRQPFSIFVSVALVKPVLREITDYLEIALSSPLVQRQMAPKGSGLQHIHLEDLRADCIPLPPLAEQVRIGSEVRRQLSLIDELELGLRASTVRADGLRSSILAAGFAGRLVPQDPQDEPVSALLERIAAQRLPKAASVRRTRRRTAAA